MRLKAHHALLPLVMALPLTCCSSEVELGHSDRLEAMLLSESDLPEGFDEVVGAGAGAGTYDSVSPEALMHECEPSDLECFQNLGDFVVSETEGDVGAEF